MAGLDVHEGPGLTTPPLQLTTDGPDVLTTLLQEVDAQVGDGRHLVVVHPAWDPDPRLLRLQTVRATLGSSRMTSFATTLPPLAAAVFAAVAAELATTTERAGALVGALADVEARLLVLARLRRLTGLREPAPGIAARLRSLLPWTHWGVTNWPEPTLVRLHAHRALVPVPTLGPDWVAVEAAQDERASWLEAGLADALGAPLVTRQRPSDEAPWWWGCPSTVEVVARPMDLSDLRRVVDDQPSTTCPWCRRTTSGPRCHGCRGLLRAEPAPAGTGDEVSS